MTMATDEQPSLFDLAEGMLAKELGQAIAEDAGRVQVWRDDAMAGLWWLACRRDEFTADDLVRMVGLPDTGTNKNNAVGAVFSGAARRGWIEPTGTYRKSRRVLSHARRITVWRGTV
jgi:hypothetical protein